MSGPLQSLTRRQCLRLALRSGLAVSGLALAPLGLGPAHAIGSQVPISAPTAAPPRLWRPKDPAALQRPA